MHENSLPESFYISLTEFLLRAKQHVVVASAEFGLTSMQALTLLMIRSDMPRPMNSFGKMYDCDASNITGIIDGLEEKNLVVREQHPNDRRIKIIRLQPAGQQLQKKLAQKLEDTSGTLFAGLCHEEKMQLTDLIQKIGRPA